MGEQTTGSGDENLHEAVRQHLREKFGRTFAVLHTPDAFVNLMLQAGLVHTKKDLRINPNGTTSNVTTLIVPRLLRVRSRPDSMAMLFEGNVGQTFAQWTQASEVLRSGLRATAIHITEPRGGEFQIDIIP